MIDLRPQKYKSKQAPVLVLSQHYIIFETDFVFTIMKIMIFAGCLKQLLAPAGVSINHNHNLYT